MVLTYTYGAPARWVARIDPDNVKGFQLALKFDPARCHLDTTQGINGVIYKNPFTQTTAPDFSQLLSGLLLKVAGDTSSTSPGDVDIYELVFIDDAPSVSDSSPSPTLPIEDAPFTVFGCSGDFIDTVNPDTMEITRLSATRIGYTTRVVTPNVFPHIWDPTGGYNNGTTGGSGTWDTISPSWDDLPSLSQPLADTAWNNMTHAHDIAVFGGNPDNGSPGGIVTVVGSIEVGGFQFDNSGYTIQGNTLTLAAPAAPPGLTPIIDTGENSATISSSLAGMGFTKLGTGTLTLTGTNTYTGATTINGGTVTVANASGGSISSSSALVLGGGALSVSFATMSNGTQAFGGTTINSGRSRISLSGGAAGHTPTLALGSIMRTAGTLDFTLDTVGPGNITTTTPNANFPGGQQTILGGYATVGGNTWAVTGISGTNNVTGLASYNAGFAASTDVDAPTGTSNPGAMTINSLRFSTAGSHTVNTGGNLTIATGGILETSTVGNFSASINNNSITSGNGQDLIIIQNNTSGNLTIGSSIVGTIGLPKSGAGTLILTGANSYTGGTLVNAGTLLVNNPSGTGNGAVMVNNSGSVIGGTGTINSPVNVNAGAAILGGDGTSPSMLTVANDLTLKFGSIIEIALGPAGLPSTHSTLKRMGGTWTFAPNQRFTFINLGGAQSGSYDNIITGLAADPGTEACWTITNAAGTFTYVIDGPGPAGHINLNITVPPPPPLIPVTLVSRKTHGGAGDFDINLPLNSPFGVECRNIGGNLTLVAAFTNDVTSGNASVTSGTGVISSPTFAGNTMTVNATGVTNVQTLTVTFSNVTDSFGQVLPNTPVSVIMLIGDTTGNGFVNATDVSQTKLQSGLPVTMANFRTDVVPTGSINSADVSLVKSRTGSGVSEPAR